MLYYLTGMSTERSAVLAYNLLHDGVAEMGETAVAETIVAPISRQEPGHYAFYKMSARGLAEQLAPWQRWLVRRLRALSFAPVGANNAEQKADFGDLMETLGITATLDDLRRARSPASSASCCGRATDGMRVPPYVARGLPRGRRARRRAPIGLTATVGRHRSSAAEHPPGDPGDVGGGLGRRAGRLHDVAEHHPDDHVDGGVEPVRRPGRRRRRATRSPTTSLAAASSDSAWVVSSGSSSVSAPWVALSDRVQQRVVLGQLEHAARGRLDRRGPGRRGAGRRRRRRPRGTGRARARIIASASAALVPISL